MNPRPHPPRWLPAVLAAGILLAPALRTLAADKEHEDCARNLKLIWDGIQKYRAQHKELPRLLSDLVPEFVSSPNLLICPVTRRTGEIKNLGLSDPKLSTSYIYEFGVQPVPGKDAAKSFTMRDWRRLQMSRVGSVVPVLRCLNHPRVLNVSFDGEVYETDGDWEATMANVIDPDALSPQRLLADVTSFATGIRASHIHPVDLSKYYNVTLTTALHDTKPDGPSLKNFPKGQHLFNGIPFNVEGAIHLLGKGLENVLPAGRYPTNVTGIAVGQPASNVYFLMGAGYGGGAGEIVGNFTVHFADGSTTTIPFHYDREVRDWWQPLPEDPNHTLKVAWAGNIGKNFSNEPQEGRIYQFSWSNPRAQTPVSTIDFTSAMHTPAPFLLGISVETP